MTLVDTLSTGSDKYAVNRLHIRCGRPGLECQLEQLASLTGENGKGELLVADVGPIHGRWQIWRESPPGHSSYHRHFG